LSAVAVDFDPTRDKSYQATRLGRSVADFLAWMETGGAAERTLDQYERDLSRGCKMFPNTPLEEFSDSQMLHVAKSFQPKERRTRVAAWKAFFKWAVRTRRIVANPCDALPTIKRQPKKVYDVFTDAEITALCGLPVRDGALFALLFDAGPRKGDCRNFHFRNWRPDATEDAPYGMLAFHEGKGGKDRQVPASEQIARKLSELAIFDGLKSAHFLWYTRPGGGSKIARDNAVGDGSFDRWWERSLGEAGVRYRNPHMTRHTFATRFLRGRGRLETLKDILGHESIQTTYDLYGHLDTRDMAYDLGLIHEITPD
jgi:integrase/recombinase XerC